MPTYDYICRTCGATFEVFQSITADKLTTCPESACKQEAKGTGVVERKIGKGAGLIFNGSGFYLTDYARAGSSSSSSSESASGSSSTTTSTSETASSAA